MNTEKVRLQGVQGTWYLIDEYCTAGGAFYLWESEQHGDDWPAVLTDENMKVYDTCCYSGIYGALLEHGLISFM